jgi:hypothetical protein
VKIFKHVVGKLNISLSDELEEKFRKVVFEKFGMKKGNINKAFEEAIDDWIQKNKSEN